MHEDQLLAEVLASISKIDSGAVDPELFDRLGIAIVRNAISDELKQQLVEEWSAHRAPTRTIENPSNPVEVKQLSPMLLGLASHPELLRHVEPIFGRNIGLFHKRFVVKDKASAGKIMLHQDSGYHTGGLRKASMFLAINPVSEQNGAMYVYPGTHRFGFLGDAGELNPAVLPAGWPVLTQNLQRGDLMIMDSRTWHGSVPFVSGPDRVMTDFIYQDANDPSTVEVVQGTGWEQSFLAVNRGEIFVQSRSTKLASIRAVLDSTTN